MKILSLECSATPASAAITENDTVLASTFVNVKFTHSQTLMPMAEALLKTLNISMSDINALAITAGPGSFTGVRIGISALKGLAAPKNLPCISVSTLHAIAENYSDTDCILCAVMDARCNQVYNAVFDIKDNNVTRLCEDRALLCDDLAKEISEKYGNSEKTIIIAGDGTDIFYPFVEEFKNVKKSTMQRRFQNAASVGIIAQNRLDKGETLTHSELLPFYLRLPQAERELKAKEKKQ